MAFYSQLAIAKHHRTGNLKSTLLRKAVEVIGDFNDLFHNIKLFITCQCLFEYKHFLKKKKKKKKKIYLWIFQQTGIYNMCSEILSRHMYRNNLSPVKRICVFEHSVMTNFNCACPAIQRGQGSGFLPEGSSWLTAWMSEQRRFWRDCADAQARLNLRCSHRR